MRILNRFWFLAAVAVLDAPFLAAQGELPTLDQALEISRESGRPIFALAGRET